MENKFGKISKLSLTASLKGEKTIISDLSFTAPFKVMRPFYEKKDIMSVMMLTASAGIMAGDRQEFEFRLEDGAKMEFVSQAYDKVHRMEEGFAERTTNISVGRGATLYYTPLPLIPFAGSDYRSTLNIELADETSELVFSEILTCGRIAYGEQFGYRRFQNNINIRQGGSLIFRDHTCYKPDEMDMTGFGMYEGFTHLATLLFVNTEKDEEWIRETRELIDQTPDMEGGVSRSSKGHVLVRILGKNADKLVNFMHTLV